MARGLSVNQRGITLVELLVTIALASAVGLLIMNMYVTSSRTYTDQSRIIDAQRGGRIALEAMSRALRHAGLDPRGSAGAGVETATATEVRATMDLNLDGDVDDSGERVAFRRAGDRIQRGVGAVGAEQWQDLADHVELFRVDYYGENNAFITAPVAAGDLARIRSMVVTLTLKDAKAGGGDFERTYSTTIYCRNLSL